MNERLKISTLWGESDYTFEDGELKQVPPLSTEEKLEELKERMEEHETVEEDK